MGRKSTLFPSSVQKKERSEMVDSIVINSLDKVSYLISSNQSALLKTDEDGNTYLHLSAYFNKVEITDLLIKSGIKVDSRDNDFLTPLHNACLNNAVGCVKLLIERGADLNSRNRDWLTPLHACAYSNSVDCLQYLIENVVCLNITDKSQATPLHYSVAQGHLETTLKLVNAGADPKLRDAKGRNCLHYASTNNNLKIIRILLEQGIDINSKDDQDRTCLHFAATTQYHDLVSYLISMGANVNQQDSKGNSPLHYACSCKNQILEPNELERREAVCRILINSGAILDLKNNLDLQTLHLDYKDGVILRAYRDKNLNIDCKDYLGRTPLHIACYRGNSHLSEALIHSGANLRSRDKFNRTPLHYAVEYSNFTVMKQLISLDRSLISLVDDNNCNALHYAARIKHSDIFNELVELYPHFNDKDNFGRTVHFYAADCVESLKRFQPIVDRLDSYNRNILFYTLTTSTNLSSASSSLEYVLSIQNLKIDINQRDTFGRTPLHYAFLLNLEQHVECLLRHDASLYIEDDRGLTPIHYLIKTDNHEGLINLIEENLIDLNSNRYKCCLLQFAAFHGSYLSLSTLIKNNYKYCLSSLVKSLEYATWNSHLNCLEIILSEMKDTNSIGDLYKCSALHIAAMRSSFECFNRLMVNLEKLDIRDEYGRTPMMFAMVTCKSKNNCVVSLLNRADCDLNALDNEHRNVLFYSVYYENYSMVKLFLKLGVNALQKSLSGKTVIHLAAIIGHVLIFKCLINNLKQNNIAYDTLIDDDGFNPLHYACYKGKSEIVKLLIDVWPEKDNILNSSKKINYLHLAAYSSDEKCMKLILNHFGQSIIDNVDWKGRNALHYLCMSKTKLQQSPNHSNSFHIRNGRISSSRIHDLSCLSECEVIRRQSAAYKLLINSQIDINCQDKFHKTPLMIAIQNSSYCKLILCLIDEPTIDLTIKDLNGLTVLHYAAKYKNELAGQKLLRKDSSLVNLVDKSGQTALHISSTNGLFELTKSLLFAGASCFIQNADGFTPALKCVSFL